MSEADVENLPSHLHENFANDDVVVVFEHSAEDHRHSVLLGLHVPEKAEVREVRSGAAGAGVPSACARGCALHGLVVSVVDHGPLLALLPLFLELEVLLEHGGEAVPLQHASLVDSLVFIGR